MDIETQFLREMQSRGYYPPEIIADGTIHRFATKDDGSDDAGWYVCDNGEDPYGVFGDWRSCNKFSWRPAGVHALHKMQDDPEKRKRIADLRNARAAAAEEQRENALVSATEYWKASKLALESHPYLEAKRIKPYGLRVGAEGELLIPVSDISGQAMTLQRIHYDGRGKRFWYGLPADKGFYLFGGDPEVENVLCVCEGYATGATIHELTGYPVCVTFSAGNMVKVAPLLRERYPEATIVVCGDDDWMTKDTKGEPWNPGREAAFKAAHQAGGLVVMPVFPALRHEKDTDFNDMVRLNGEDLTKALITVAASGEVVDETQAADALAEIKADIAIAKPPPWLLTVPGVLGSFCDWMNRTANVYQPQFSVTAALALGAVALGRNWKTDRRNWPALYFLNIGPTGVGKEHINKCITDVLMGANLDRCSGAGYTSAGAVISALWLEPAHVSVTDEFGLKQKSTDSGNDINGATAQQMLMSAWGACDGVLRPNAYSQQGQKKGAKVDKEELRLQHQRNTIWNPCLSIIGMTTGATLYDNLSSGHIRSGYLNRFIVNETMYPTTQVLQPDNDEAPEDVIEWVKMVSTTCSPTSFGNTDGNVKAQPNIIPFSPEAEELRVAFLRKIENLREDMRAEGNSNEELLTRTVEMSMRIAMIVALSKGRMGEVNGQDIDAESMKWAIEYVEFYAMRLLAIAEMHIHDSQTSRMIATFTQAFKDRRDKGYTLREMWGVRTLKIPKRQRDELMEILEEAGTIVPYEISSARGKAVTRYFYRGYQPGGRLRTKKAKPAIDTPGE